MIYMFFYADKFLPKEGTKQEATPISEFWVGFKKIFDYIHSKTINSALPRSNTGNWRQIKNTRTVLKESIFQWRHRHEIIMMYGW